MERSNPLYKVRRKCQAVAQRLLPDETLARFYSRIIMKQHINLEEPQTFNEKVQWCKINAFPYEKEVVRCADKVAVRGFVEDRGLSSILVPCLGVWSEPFEIDWESLPNQFVLKCNHGCAYNIICPNKSKADKYEVKSQLAKWLKEDFGVYNIELHYSQIFPHLVVGERFLGEAITDFKFFCFNGKPRYIYVSYDLAHDREAQIGFFDLNGSPLELKRDDYAPLSDAEFPSFYQAMLDDAKTLCDGFPFVRVDFFVTSDRYYFAEMTFTPSAGMMPFNPPRYDIIWGEELDISEYMSRYGKGDRQ